MKFLLVVGLLAAAAFFAFGYGHHHSKASAAAAVTAVQLHGVTVTLDRVASTAAEQRQGYQSERAAVGHAILFTWSKPGLVPFWMKNTPAALDLVWLDQGRRVLGRVVMPPCHADPCPTYAAPRPFVAALEAPAGTFRRVRVGEVAGYVTMPATARNPRR